MDCKQVQEQHLNDLFNQALERQIKGKLPKGYIYQLGHPNDILLSAGIPDLPIELSAEILFAKSKYEYINAHPFSLNEVKNLPDAIANPIAIFNSRTRKDCKVILTELHSKGVNFVVAMQLNKQIVGLKINSIRSIYPKDYIQDIFNWTNSGYLQWVNKNKALDLIANTSTPSDVTKIKGSTLATKIIQDFENPKLAEKRRIKIPSKISGTVLSQAQRINLANGDTIQLEVIHKGVKQNVNVRMDEKHKAVVMPTEAIEQKKSQWNAIKEKFVKKAKGYGL